uniref:Uncharacterized protein n=1 Tax=Anguilla anguilla TaxID=7936 RepID=A0A0E9UAZ8_ANGAN
MVSLKKSNIGKHIHTQLHQRKPFKKYILLIFKDWGGNQTVAG